MSNRKKTEPPVCWAVLPAAGSGQRMGSAVAKQYLTLAGRPVICWAIEPFLQESRVRGIVVVVAPGDRQWNACIPEQSDKLLLTTQGGSDRARSVRNGLAALAGRARDQDWVLVHDAARPCLAAADLDCLLGRLWDDEVGGLLALPVRDTLKQEADSSARVAQTISRRGKWLALTPQMFRYAQLRDALDAALAGGQEITDEASAMELAGHAPRLVEARPHNLKITYPQDLGFAENLLAEMS